MRHWQRGLLVGYAADTERDADRNWQLFNRAVRLDHQYRRVPSRGCCHLALCGVEYQIAAAGQLAGQVTDDGLQDIHQLPRRHARPGQGIGRRTQTVHDGRSPKAAAHHFPDQHPGVPGT